jgi:hypothetical protein
LGGILVGYLEGILVGYLGVFLVGFLGEDRGPGGGVPGGRKRGGQQTVLRPSHNFCPVFIFPTKNVCPHSFCPIFIFPTKKRMPALFCRFIFPTKNVCPLITI